jgi:hypothetical protein
MTNVYVFGSLNFIKESIKGFNLNEYKIFTSDHAELFKIQLSKENDPSSIILIDQNMIEDSGFLNKLNPFRNKNKLSVDFIKSHPLLNNELSSLNVDEYNQVKATIFNENVHFEEEIPVTTSKKPTSPSPEPIREESTIEDEPVETQAESEEFDLEALLAAGVDSLDDKKNSSKSGSDDDFDLEALLAAGVDSLDDGDNNDDFDLDALIASTKPEPKPLPTPEPEETPMEESMEDLEAMMLSEMENEVNKVEEPTPPTPPMIENPPHMSLPSHFNESCCADFLKFLQEGNAININLVQPEKDPFSDFDPLKEQKAAIEQKKVEQTGSKTDENLLKLSAQVEMLVRMIGRNLMVGQQNNKNLSKQEENIKGEQTHSFSFDDVVTNTIVEDETNPNPPKQTKKEMDSDNIEETVEEVVEDEKDVVLDNIEETVKLDEKDVVLDNIEETVEEVVEDEIEMDSDNIEETVEEVVEDEIEMDEKEVGFDESEIVDVNLNTSLTEEKSVSEMSKTEEDKENANDKKDKKLGKTKTMAQSMMETFSEDEIVRMVMEGKL